MCYVATLKSGSISFHRKTQTYQGGFASSFVCCQGTCKSARHCGPGCDCHGCTNLFEGTESNHQDPDDQSDAESEETGQEDQNSQCSSGSEDEEEVGIETEMITDTFDQLMLEQLDMT